MVDYQAVGFIGNRHTSGKRSDGPLLLSPGDGPHLSNPFAIPAGTFGWARFQYSHGTNTPFVANRILTGGTSTAKARVLYEIDSAGNNKQVVVELLTPTIPFRAGEVVTDNSSPAKSATLALSAAGAPLLPTNSTIEFPVTGQDRPRNLLSELFNPVLNSFVPAGLIPNDMWWDYGAKLALPLDVSSVASIPQWSVIIGATSGATGLVTAVTGAAPGVARVAPYSGTAFQVGEQIDIVGGGTNVATVLNVPAPRTRGEWTVYHAMPNTAGFGAGFETPPGGSDSCGHRGALGMETYVLHEAYKRWGGDLKGMKFDASAIYDASGIGGVCVGVVKCDASGFGTTWGVGEIVTAAGGWSAKVIGHDAVKKWVYVRSVEGTLAPGVITGATSGATATALDNVFGWMKGAKFWLGLLDEVAAMTAKLPAGSHTMTWKLLQVSTCDGDMQAPGGTMALSSGDIATAAAKFAGDLRIALASPGLVLSFLLPDVAMRPVSAPGMADLVRKGLVAANRIDPLSRYFYLDGFELAAPTLAQTSIGTDPIEWETFAYVEAGRRSWRSYLASTLVSSSTNYSHAAVVTVTGQSQLAQGNWEVLKLIGDADMAKLPAGNPMNPFNPISTLNPDILIWNELTGAMEIFDVSVNACGWGDTHPGSYGLNVTLLPRLQGRYGRIYCFYMPYGGSAMQAVSISQGGTWDPDGFAPYVVTQTMTVTVPVAGTGRFTASSGVPFLAIPIGTVTQITGSTGIVGAGGNNTAPMRGRTVSAIAPDGTWVELSGDFIAEGPKAFVLTFGPHNLDAAMESTARKGLTWLTDNNLIPFHVLDVTWQGEADGLAPATFPPKAAGHVARKRALFGPKPPGSRATPSLWLQPSAHTSFGTDEQLAALLAAFPILKTQLNADGRFDIISTNQLTFRMDGGPYPRPLERNYSPAPTGYFHHDDKAMWQAGWLVDLAIDAHPEWEIPPHPNGPVAWLTGAGGQAAEEEAEPEVAELDGGVAELVDPVAAATGLEEAMAESPDVGAYTNPDGSSATRRSLDELQRALDRRRGDQVRQMGFDRTHITFGDD